MKSISYRWYIFLVLGAQYILLYLHRMSPAVLAPDLIKAFHISGTALGFLSSAYFYTYAAMQVPAGMFSDRLGVRKTVVSFGLLGVAGSVLFAVAQTLYVAIVARVLIGLGVSVIFVSAMKILAECFKGREYARVAGLFYSIGGLGWLLGASPLAALTLLLDWRTIHLLLSFIMLCLICLTWFILRNDGQKTGATKVINNGPNEKEGTSKSPWKLLLSDTHFWSSALWFFSRTGILFSFFGLWAGPYVMDVHGFSNLQAGQILSMAPLGIIVGGPLLGYISERLLMSRKIVTVGTSILHSAFWIIMALFSESLRPGLLYVIFFLMGIVAGSPGSVAFASIRERFPPSIAATSIGAINLTAFLGSVILQPFIGYVLDVTGKVGAGYSPSGYTIAFYFYLIISCIGLVSILFSKETLQDA